MPRRVFVTGGSGFVGQAAVRELLAKNRSVRALVHSRSIEIAADELELVKGQLLDADALDKGMLGCDAVVHLVGIIMEKPGKGVTFERMHVEATRHVVEAAERNSVRRYVHMSALGSRPDARSRYHQTKFAAEEIVRSSSLDWTIFRPSLIHGPGGDFMKMEAGWARKSAPPFAFMPYFGGGIVGNRGAGRLQPIAVEDVARAFVESLDTARSVRQVYEMGGEQRLNWPEMHQLAAQAIVGHRRWVLPIPAWYAKALTRIAPARLLPFNYDQVVMSEEDNVCDLAAFERDFGWRPEGFASAVAKYAAQL